MASAQLLFQTSIKFPKQMLVRYAQRFILLVTLYNGSWHSNCCMVTPAHLKVASSLPTFSGWIPGQDRGQIATIGATRDVEDSSNHSGFWPMPILRKISSWHCSPRDCAATGVNCYLSEDIFFQKTFSSLWVPSPIIAWPCHSCSLTTLVSLMMSLRLDWYDFSFCRCQLKIGWCCRWFWREVGVEESIGNSKCQLKAW